MNILLKGNLPPEAIAIVFIGIAVVLLFRFVFSSKAKIRRKLRSMPRTNIADVKEGELVKVAGKIIFAGRTVQAGLSNRTCAYYHIEVEEYRSTGKSGRWLKIIDDRKRGDVVLFDGTGYAVLQGKEVQTLFYPDVKYRSGSFQEPLPEMEAYLEQHKKKGTNWLGFNKGMRYREGILEENELCAMAGVAIWLPAGKVRVDVPAERVLVIRGTPDVNCYISDHPDTIGEGLDLQGEPQTF